MAQKKQTSTPAAPTAANPSSTKKLVTGEFLVSEHPLPKFFKDEGGKKNCLIAWVKVLNANADGTKVDFGEQITVPTLATLCYEGGELVEEKHQYIFNVANGKNGTRTFAVPANGTATRLLFRIEKVSRRFDSRKFMVKLTAQKPAADDEYDFTNLIEANTNAVEVFSKRKVKNIDPEESFGRMRPRTSQNCKRAALDAVEAEFMEQFHDMQDIFNHQQTQMDNVMDVLQSRKIVRKTIKATHSSSGPAHPLTSAGDVVRPPSLLGFDRFTTTDLAFNFGPPTPIAAPVLDPRRRH